MKVRDEDPAPAPCPPATEVEPERESLYGGLLRMLRHFEEVNSAFGHVRTFLEARGLHNVSELDAEGRAALLVYLEGVRARLQADRP